MYVALQKAIEASLLWEGCPFNVLDSFSHKQGYLEFVAKTTCEVLIPKDYLRRRVTLS